MSLTKYGAARLAAGKVTASERRRDAVAADFVAWLDAKSDLSTAVDALISASGLSKYPVRVLAIAEELYGEIDALPEADPLAALSATFARRALRKAAVAGKVPAVMATPPTLTLSAANAATSIASGVSIKPENRAAFTYIGGDPAYGTGFPQNLYYQTTNTHANSSPPSWAVEFDLDSALGKFEVEVTGSGAEFRVMVDGDFASASESFATPADGNGYRLIVNFGAAAKKRIRIEFTSNARFGGVTVGPADGVVATPPRLKAVVVGDSYTEPTIIDSGAYFAGSGFAQWVGYITGWDVRNVGSGGTGYLNPSTGGKVKLRDRLTDVYLHDPDVVIVCMGLNDRAYAGATATALQTEVAAVIDALQANLPDAYLYIASQFWPGGPQKYAENLLWHRDAIRAAAQAEGIDFLDLLETTPPIAYTATTTAAAAVGATTISVNTSMPARADGARNYWIRIGTGANSEVRFVTGQTGTGPYSLQFTASGALTVAHGVGETVTVVGPGFITGTGRQGATANNGNADRYIGNDGSHPTAAGHEFLGRALTDLLTAVLPI